MLASVTMTICIISCFACLVLMLLGFYLTTRDSSQPHLNIKAARIQVYTDNSVTKKLSKSLTKSSQRPVLQDTFLAADSSTARNRWTEKRTHRLAGPTSSSDTPIQSADSLPTDPNLQVEQTFKMENKNPI